MADGAQQEEIIAFQEACKLLDKKKDVLRDVVYKRKAFKAFFSFLQQSGRSKNSLSVLTFPTTFLAFLASNPADASLMVRLSLYRSGNIAALVSQLRSYVMSH